MSFPEPLRMAGSLEKRVLQDCGLMLSLLGSKGSHFNLFIILKQLLCANPCSVASVTTVKQIHRHPHLHSAYMGVGKANNNRQH